MEPIPIEGPLLHLYGLAQHVLILLRSIQMRLLLGLVYVPHLIGSQLLIAVLNKQMSLISVPDSL